MKNVLTSTEIRSRCMMKRIHNIEEEDVVYTYKRKKFYRCKTCGRSSFKRGLRPSAESASPSPVLFATFASPSPVEELI